MSSGPPDEWSLLLQLQSDSLLAEDLRLKHQSHLRKLLYRQHLDDHIALSSSKTQHSKHLDLQILHQQQKQDLLYTTQLQQRSVEKTKLRKEVLEYNMKAVREREEEGRRVRKREKEGVGVMLGLEREGVERKERKERQRVELMGAYEERMGEGKRAKERVRTEENRFVEEWRRAEEKRERERGEFLWRIRYGFRQNPEVERNFREIERRKEEDRSEKICSYIGRGKGEEYSFPVKLKTTNSTNQSPPSSYPRTPSAPTNPPATPEQTNRLQELRGQMEMGDILDRQIQEKELQRVKEKHMNSREVRYNKDGFQGTVAVQGLAVDDYQRRRQREMLNDSIGLGERLRGQGGGKGEG